MVYDYSVTGDRLVFQFSRDTTAYIEELDSTLTFYTRIYNEAERVR